MTMPIEMEIEAREIPASHLLSVRCASCGGRTLAAPGRERSARCATCWGGSVIVPAGSLPYTTPVGFPLLRRMSVAQAREPYPAPEVDSRSGVEPAGGMPDVVAKLAAAGSAARWDVRTQYARGCLPHASYGTPGASQGSWAVRFSRAGWGAWAVYRAGSWAFVWMWGETLLPFGAGNVTDLKAWLARGCDDLDDPAFFGAIRERLADQAERDRLRKLCEAGKHGQLVPGLGPLRWKMCVLCGNDAGWKKIKKGKAGDAS